MFASGLITTWSVAVGVQLRRVEGRYSAIAFSQMLLGALFTLEFIIPFMILQAAAFRTERSDEAIQALIDVAWIMFIGTVGTFMLQAICIGVGILQDQRTTPIYPRWSGYFTIWAALLTQAGALTVFFHTGPFAWNGLLSFWLAIAAYAPFMIVLSGLTVRAIHTQQPDDDSVAVELRRRSAECVTRDP